MSESQATQTVTSSHRGPSQPHRRGRGGGRGRGRGGGPSSRTSQGGDGRGPPTGGGAAPATMTVAADVRAARVVEGEESSSRTARGRRGGNRHGQGRGAGPHPQSHMAPRRNFGGRLTTATEDTESQSGASALSAAAPAFVPGQPVSQSTTTPPVTQKRGPATRRFSKSSAPDLPTRIHEDIDHGQYECVICSGEVVRNSRAWSCSICWTVVHLHCVKKWHTSQLKNSEQPQGQIQTWRCPGCNSSMTEEPGSYHCWCGKEINPKPIMGLPPHSCGQTCSKPRATCPHPCSLNCHAGPCPPCTLMGPVQTCFCGKHTSQKRCSETDYSKGWSCREVCGDFLPCGEHACPQPCHPGLCGSCELPIPSICYCGKERRDVPCDRRDDLLDSYNYGQLHTEMTDESETEAKSWFEGSFHCNSICERTFDCGVHSCTKSCHPQDEDAAHCPLSPDVVTSCPCGKTPLTEILNQPRESCQDKVPHCDKVCGKLLSCGHSCDDTCHTGPCRSCLQSIEIPCRCGRTTVTSVCHQGDVQKPECFRVCRAQLSCGRHECGQHCCPGEKKAAERVAARRKNRGAVLNDDVEDEHFCPRLCGRTLKCGKHTCEQLCHKGPCPSCLEAVFEEVSCSCGRTVLYPPQPCGTRPPECRFDCTRPRACGHPQVQHQCHPDDASCPKCPFLVEKSCICGKKMLKNQPCWFEESRCGLPCGKTLKCGTHTCQKSCHRPGECEDAGIVGSHCLQPCGKTRTSCEHACIEQCHAPFPCKEEKPCQLEVFVTCECQRRKQKVKCLASRSTPGGPQREPLKCDDECLRQKRNRQLADALNIDPETHTNEHIPYQDLTLKFFKDHAEWAQTQEREFRVFAESDLKNMRFKPMKPHQRQFLHTLAEDYGLDSESQDPEPHRHVSLFKGPRFVSAPNKTLMQCLKISKVVAARMAALAVPKPAGQQAFNALLLSNPRFGLTIDEIDTTLASEINTQTGPALAFTTSFLPNDEVVIKATPKITAASIASAPAPTPAQIESTLAALKPKVAKSVTQLGLAGGVSLCYADASLNVERREGDAVANNGGWNTVASRAAARPARLPTPQAPERKAPSSFLALRKLKKKEDEPVDEDWEAAADKLDDLAVE